MNRKIRLVVFDMGEVLWTEVEDSRAILWTELKGNRKVFIDKEGGEGRYGFYMIDENSMFRRPGIANRLRTGVKELFEELYRRRIHVSIDSLNVPEAWRWIEQDFFNLNINGFVKYSKIANPVDKELIKGIWLKEIIEQWNQNECKEDPIRNEQVLFVDDNKKNHKDVLKVCPGVTCIYPITYGKKGMLRIIEVIEIIERENFIQEF
ncbi:MAG: hypothetical protein ACTSU2_08160 [Promethearchaeota archaeon]